jgi:hypothetical protein
MLPFDHPAVVGGILDPGGLAAIFAELEFTGLLWTRQHLTPI